jgi:site-specific DNA-methyltransferase (adenine-specific)
MENLRRKNLSPIDQAKAIATLHRLLKAEQGLGWSEADTGHTVENLRGEVRTSSLSVERTDNAAAKEVADSLILENFANDPDVAKAKSRSEAVKIANKKMELELLESAGELIQDQKGDLRVIQGDCRAVMQGIPANSFHGIIVDPPYGIGADEFGEQTSAEGHVYEDSEAEALTIIESILREGFRITKEDAHMYLFCDIRLWPAIQATTKAYGWTPWATPIIWHKPGLGHAPQPGYFGRRYECILFAQKGSRKLSHSASDVITFPAVKDKIHAAQKPVELIQELIRLSFFPGESIIDPCCGSGTIFLAGYQEKIKVTGIERDEKFASVCKQVINEVEGEKK